MSPKRNEPSRKESSSGLFIEMPTRADRKKDMYMSAGSLADGTRLSGKRISSLMRSGAIEGVKVEGQWVGTRSSVSQYLERGGNAEKRTGGAGRKG
jgi:hypothetical protein